jgi:hypothetical protein
MNLIPTKVHGVLDYLSVLGMFLASRTSSLTDRTRRLLAAMAVLTLLYSLLTRYELGVVKVLPMKGHLTLDGSSGVLFCAAPLALSDEEQPVLLALVAFGLFELVVTAISKQDSSAS